MVNLLVYIVSTLFTYIFGILSKHFKWNDNLPIPVQNVVIGLITFSIFYALYLPQNPEEIIEQIIVALGGCGTATLSYDLSKVGKGDEK